MDSTCFLLESHSRASALKRALLISWLDMMYPFFYWAKSDLLCVGDVYEGGPAQSPCTRCGNGGVAGHGRVLNGRACLQLRGGLDDYTGVIDIKTDI